MSVGLVSILAIVGIACAGLSLACFNQARQDTVIFVALCAGLLCGVALTVSGFLLMQDWPAQMEHFDFTEASRAERGRGWGIMSAIYFWPYEATGAGAVATFLFGQRLYDLLRGADRG